MRHQPPTIKVPSKDYARQYRAIAAEVHAAVDACLFGDAPILGEALSRFEGDLARYHEVDEAVGVGSGSDALTLSLQALGVGEGDEVITGAHTFPGVVSAILRAGATPRLVDGDPASGLMTAAAAEAAVGPSTGAILAVHMYGHPVDASALAALSARRGIPLIEDVAQAHGARWEGQPVGSFGAAACLSFHPSKNLGAFGDGGAILTSDAKLAARLRVMRNLGKADKYQFEVVAPNSKLDTLQAAILGVKLPHLDTWVSRRRALARRYLDDLADVPGVTLPTVDPLAEHAWHLFVIRTAERDALKEALAGQGIKTSLHYPIAAPDHPAFEGHIPTGDFPVARAFARECLSLPVSHELTDAEVGRVIVGVRAFFLDGGGR